MKVLLVNADGTPAVVETSEQEKLLALCIRAFGLITGACPRTEADYQQWIAQLIAVVGAETIERAYPGLKVMAGRGVH